MNVTVKSSVTKSYTSDVTHSLFDAAVKVSPGFELALIICVLINSHYFIGTTFRRQFQ